jgi:type IV fimbrial biogenesis protein FimT
LGPSIKEDIMHINQFKGFNLIELMMGILIFSLLSIIASPSLKSLLLESRADSNIRTIQQTLILARNIAISYGTRVTVCPIENNKCSQKWGEGLSVFIDAGSRNQIDAGDTIIHETGSFNDDDIVKYNRAAIRFQPDGLASGTNGTLRYCPEEVDSPHAKALVVNQAGRVRFSTKKNIDCN